MGSNFMPEEKYYPLKSIFERVWGKGTFLKLKHCSDVNVWKRFCERTVRATSQAISETVSVADDDWREELAEITSHGLELIKLAKTIDDLVASFAATYVEISFHQIGFMPAWSNRVCRDLRPGSWQLDVYRTAQYVQSSEQRKRVLARKVKQEAAALRLAKTPLSGAS